MCHFLGILLEKMKDQRLDIFVLKIYHKVFILEGDFMKRIVFVFTFMAINLFTAFCGGIQQKGLVNTQEIKLDRINAIEIRYNSEEITVLNNNSDTLVIKEYMTDNNSDYYAKITNSGNKLIVEAGRRPLFNASFRVSIEVYIPVTNKNITIKTSSGKIEAASEYTVSSMNIESSSGSISVNSITADKVNLKSSSGDINCIKANGNTTIETSSGSIVCSIINGDLLVKSSSGAISLDQVSGSLNASARSGRLRSGAIGGNADIHTSSGSIVVNGVNGNFTAETSSGSVYCVAAENAGDITITTSSGDVTLDIPRNFVFNFSSRSSSGNLHTPFSDRLFSPLSDKNSVQGVIGNDNASQKLFYKNISIKTSSGSIRVNWIN
jgi:DUF4097 and DUF4098 domain-containing protein YvlB